VFEDVLSEYCKGSGDMSKTLPPGFFGRSGMQRNSTCWGMDGDLSASAPNTPDLSSLRKSMIKHAARGVVRRVTLDPQSIC